MWGWRLIDGTPRLEKGERPWLRLAPIPLPHRASRAVRRRLGVRRGHIVRASRANLGESRSQRHLQNHERTASRREPTASLREGRSEAYKLRERRGSGSTCKQFPKEA